ncbi:MAG: dTMP kinase [Dehalococcoidales bacterium]|nr:dTMP kinase [Dehalococcoidales bacterium]
MSLFITFEGGEGSGKSFQSNVLFKLLSRDVIPAIHTREPGGTPLGEEITKCLKWQVSPISPLAELLLFNASRSHLVETVINPALKEGKVVICDRFTDSTVVYQGFGRQLDMETIEKVNSLATGDLKPDLTILMDILPGIGLARKRGQKRDRFEKESLTFHNRIRRGYLELAAKEPERWLVIDAGKSKEDIARQIWHRVRELLKQKADGDIEIADEFSGEGVTATDNIPEADKNTGEKAV